MNDLISRQAAIDAINHICPVDTEYDCTLLDRVDVRCVLSDLPSAQPEPRWIPVNEHLPDLGIVVWVTLIVYGRNIVTKGQWNGVNWIYPKSCAKITLEVLAWMSIQVPKPYERSEDGSKAD